MYKAYVIYVHVKYYKVFMVFFFLDGRPVAKCDEGFKTL